jgi:hypothetical protein
MTGIGVQGCGPIFGLDMDNKSQGGTCRVNSPQARRDVSGYATFTWR